MSRPVVAQQPFDQVLSLTTFDQVGVRHDHVAGAVCGGLADGELR